MKGDEMRTGQRQMNRRWLIVAAALGLVVATLTGCSDDDPPAGDTGMADAMDMEDGGDDGGDTDDGGMQTDLMIPGLSAPVTVQFDSSGVLHIDCQTNLDCYRAQGYFHADARMFQMDVIRRQTLGELATLIGSNGVGPDRQFQRLMKTREGEPLAQAYYDATSDETKAMLQAYADGVNAWLDDMRNRENGAELTREYDDQIFVKDDTVPDWEPRDTIALYFQLAYQLSETATEDLSRGVAASTVGDTVASDLFSVKPGLESNVIDAAQANQPMSLGGSDEPSPGLAYEGAYDRLHPVQSLLERTYRQMRSAPSLLFGPRTAEDGSNNWVVAPERTQDGNALLANDPHLTLNTPPIWYMVELDSKTNGEGDLHVAGASIPSVPGVVIGHNEQVGWGVTTARLDLADAYVETLGAQGDTVIFEENGQETQVQIVEKTFTVEVANGENVEHTVEYVPHHGPIIEKDEEAGTATTIKWVLNEPGNDIDFIRDLMTATSVDEAKAALEPVRAINQNWVFVDTQGNIGWKPAGAIPDRPWADEYPNWLPLPGDGSAEWQGFLEDSEEPGLTNPANGTIVTANNDFDGSYTDGNAANDGHVPWQAPPALGHRHARIVELLNQGGNDLTAQTMHDIQADTYSKHAEILVPHVLETANANSGDLSSAGQSVVSALSNWNYTCPDGVDGTNPNNATKVDSGEEVDESIGCAAFHALIPRLSDAAFSDELENFAPEYGLDRWARLQEALIYLFDDPDELANGDAYFDNVTTDGVTETEADVVVTALENTADALDDTYGTGMPDDWRWGFEHTVTLRSLLSGGGLTVRQEGPYVNDGGYYTVDVASPRANEGDYSHRNGPSVRVVFEATGDGMRGSFSLPGGQSNHENSPYYNNLIGKWLSNTPTDLLFERDAVDANAEQTLTVGPAEQ
jgi:penicillin amidase